MMHEKMAIIKVEDGKDTSFMGSYNWTHKASTSHYENCIFLTVGVGTSSVNKAAMASLDADG